MDIVRKVFCSATTWIIFFECVILIFLYCCGFRITYAPALDNNWDAISACAAWFGVVASAIAVVVAINIPKKLQRIKIELHYLTKDIDYMILLNF